MKYRNGRGGEGERERERERERGKRSNMRGKTSTLASNMIILLISS
jgi:hypothetical protein